MNTKNKIILISSIILLSLLGLQKVYMSIPKELPIVKEVYAIEVEDPTPKISGFESTEAVIVEDAVIEIAKQYDDETVEVLTNVLYGEARGLNDTHKSAVIWCILNRYDTGKYGKSIIAVATAKHQFAYNAKRIFKDQKAYESCKQIVIDVLDRYYTEEQIGRTLPKDYLYFYGDGKVNHFRNKFKGNYTIWDWSLESPYEN